MNDLAAPHIYTVPERMEKAVRRIRRALHEAKLCVMAEFDSAQWFGTPKDRERSKILLVDCPLLAFEAQALDQRAGVFFPLHLLIRSDGERTHISAVSASELYDRLPPGVAAPMRKLEERVATALDAVVSWARSDHRDDRGEKH